MIPADEDIIREKDEAGEPCDDEAVGSMTKKELFLELCELHGQVSGFKAEREELLDLARRTKAEYANYRKRVQREREELVRAAGERLVKEILPVVDDLKRALESREQGESFRQGVENIFAKLKEALKKEGVTAVEARGKPFDPRYHQALMEVENDEYPEGTVVDEVTPGYLLGERVLRPALVTVAKKKSTAREGQSADNDSDR